MSKGTKTGGRQKGTPNKKTQELMELIEANYKGFNPVLELIKIAMDKNTPLDLKASVLKDVASYIYPKRKAIDAKLEDNLQRVIVVASEADKKLLEDI